METKNNFRIFIKKIFLASFFVLAFFFASRVFAAAPNEKINLSDLTSAYKNYVAGTPTVKISDLTSAYENFVGTKKVTPNFAVQSLNSISGLYNHTVSNVKNISSDILSKLGALSAAVKKNISPVAVVKTPASPRPSPSSSHRQDLATKITATLSAQTISALANAYKNYIAPKSTVNISNLSAAYINYLTPGTVTSSASALTVLPP